jgi:DNA helicase II / ATP-dependent DNA helicase PcrA
VSTVIKLRSQQEIISRYTQGKMGVSAVPGSGKTHTLSYLAAQLISRGLITDDQEILIVTLVNSAVENFNQRIGGFVQALGLFPNLGYRVRTLHGLAHDIIRERPDLAGLSDQFQILDEAETDEILKSSVQKWHRLHPEFTEEFLSPDVDLRNPARANQWNEWLMDLNRSLIRSAKDKELQPFEIRECMNSLGVQSSLIEMGLEVFRDYQRALSFRNGVDFDDLVRLALQSIRGDKDYLEYLRRRWPFILEDEAQDSNLLQEKILRLLSGDNGNWVRVGDPNQAIYETFTTASPQYLIDFLQEPGVKRHDLPISGRSSSGIQDLANYLIEWSRGEQNPNPELTEALQLPYIQPTPPNDPQPNPPDNETQIHFSNRPYKPDEEIQVVVKNLKKWLAYSPEKTAAILVPRNDRGAKLVEEFKKIGIEPIELLRSSRSTRAFTANLVSILKYLDEPASTSKLVKAYKDTRQIDTSSPSATDLVKGTAEVLSRCTRVEDYLWPQPDNDWLSGLIETLSNEILQELIRFRMQITRWQEASLLPVDQLILTISLELFKESHELALAHKIALFLERAAQNHPDWVLSNFIVELETITQQRRKFSGFASEDVGFDPQAHKGKVVIATIHKAKGLEWDRVHLVSVNNYDFPMALPGESFIAERWFIKNQINAQAVMLGQLEAIMNKDIVGFLDQETPCQKARTDYAAERLRLFYVGITRAKSELIATWNTGQRKEAKPTPAFTALQSYLSENHDITNR